MIITYYLDKLDTDDKTKGWIKGLLTLALAFASNGMSFENMDWWAEAIKLGGIAVETATNIATAEFEALQKEFDDSINAAVSAMEELEDELDSYEDGIEIQYTSVFKIYDLEENFSIDEDYDYL